MRKLLEWCNYFQPKVGALVAAARTIPRVMEMANNSGCDLITALRVSGLAFYPILRDAMVNRKILEIILGCAFYCLKFGQML